MANLTTGLGVALDNLRITVTSVETHDGPGLMLFVRHQTADRSRASRSDEEDGAGGDNPPE
ncbi:MAG: hypothetical protein ACLPXU_03360 [Acidimicrobiales bacterium]|jgi:hypothetical protein